MLFYALKRKSYEHKYPTKLLKIIVLDDVYLNKKISICNIFDRFMVG